MAHHPESDDQFNTLLTENADKLVIVDFFATWCGPCKQIAPAFEALAAEHSDVVFIKVDVDELEDIAEQFNVSAMPTFIAVKNKVQVGSAVLGANLDKLKSLVKDNK